MRYVSVVYQGKKSLGVREGEGIRIIGNESLEELLARGVNLKNYGDTFKEGTIVAEQDVTYLPPLSRPPKIICVGLNYAEHTKESNFEQPDYPALFLRVNTSLVAHAQPMVRPAVTDSEG